MKKEGFSKLLNSNEGKVNLLLFFSIMAVFVATFFVFESTSVNALNITLISPRNFTYNYSNFNATRNINFTFNVTWFFGGAAPALHENVSNCSLYVNGSTLNYSTAVKNVSTDTTGHLVDNRLINRSDPAAQNVTSWMNFTFPTDGNYTFGIACYNFTNATAVAVLHFSENFTFFLDTSPPQINFTNLSDHYNRSNTGATLITFAVNDSGIGLNVTQNFIINLTVILGNSVLRYFTYQNDSSSSNLTCNITAEPSENATARNPFVCNATFNFVSNGTHLFNITATDRGGLTNSSAIRVTIDQIPPVAHIFNITHNATLDLAAPVGVELGNGTLAGASTAQGRTIVVIANWTDNMTTSAISRVLQGTLEFFNVTSNNWEPLNYSPSNYRAYNNDTWTNFSFPIPRGHSQNWEGKNVSFRVFANDTLSNKNTTNDTKNFTILVNDTTVPTITVSVGSEVHANLTNTSDTTPTVVWNVTEINALQNISIQIDGSTSISCNKLTVYSRSDLQVEGNRNGTVTVSSSAGCPLNNGTRVVRVTAEDIWGNQELYIHSITVNDEQGRPNVTLRGLANGFAAVNQSNVTPTTGINFSSVSLGQGVIKNLSFTTSCNSSLIYMNFTNNTAIWPFNYSDCWNIESNQTVTVTSFDYGGVSHTQLFQFFVDNLAPRLTVTSPVEGQQLEPIFEEYNISLNWSVRDTSRVSFVGYYRDDAPTPTELNRSAGMSVHATNFSDFRNINFTPGMHRIKFTASDALGATANSTNNTVNSSVITFFVKGPINFGALSFNGSSAPLAAYNANSSIMLVNLTNTSIGAGSKIETRNITNENLSLLLVYNGSHKGGRIINVTLIFNGTAANWDKYNFSIEDNNTQARFGKGFTLNQTMKVIDMISFNLSIEEFIRDEGYYGMAKIPLNATSTDIGGNVKVLYFENSTNFKNPTNVTECDSTFVPTITSNANMPCWNNTDNKSIVVYVPHFSHIVIANDTVPPTVAINTPRFEQTESSFIPNITVSDDVKNCSFTYNFTSAATTTFIGMTIEEGATTTTCYNTTAITNVTNGTMINITFYVYDASGNLNHSSFNTTINDTTVYNISSISIGSVGTASAVVTVAANESVNLSIKNNTGSGTITASNYGNTSTYTKSQSITFSSLSASTTYNFTVTSCDRAGNCLTNTTLGFTTSAADTTTTTTTTTTTSGGGGGGGAASPSNEVATASRKWDSLAAGSTAALTVNNEQVAVTGVVIDVKNAVTNAEVKVASLSSNPYTAAAAAKVYQYLQLSKGNIADSDASKITINFRVPKSWLTTNNVKEDDVVIYRYSESKWNALTTTRTGADANNVMYQTTTPGFSTFAIGSKEAAPVTAPTEEKPAEVTPPTAEVPAEVPKEEAPAAPAKKPGLSSTAMAWIVVAIIVAAAGVGYYMMQKKKER